MGEPGVIDLNDKRPFRAKAREYRAKGWLNTLWLPLRAKEPPPTGFTGRPADGISNDVTEDILEEWMAGPYTERANIAIHLGFGVTIKSTDSTGKVTAQESTSNGITSNGTEYCVLGIDVDENDDNPKKPKRGWSQLKRLEKVLGEELPPTWTSSARDNGTSGIRFYLVPKGLEWRGSCSESGGKHIDIVSFAHKYSIVYPSIHPLGTQYLWYPPGVSPSGPSALGNRLGEIPNATDLTVLGPKWVDYLSRGGTVDTGAVPIEMDRSIKELKQWCIDEFVPGLGEGCTMIQNAVAKHLENIENNADHHYPLQEAHWHLFLLGAEGHHGWLTAIKTIEKAWRARIADEGAASKRSVEKAESELERSRNGALRKLRGKADARAKEGYQFISRIELCGPSKASKTAAVDNSGGGGGAIFNVSRGPIRPPESYQRSDDGNAEMLIDMYEGNLRYVKGALNYWIFWDGARWHVDTKNYVRHLFRNVRDEQIAAGKRIIADGRAKMDDELIKFGNNLETWGHRSGNHLPVTCALKQAESFPNVVVELEDLDADPMLLGLSNGVLKFYTQEERENGSPAFELMDSDKDLLITMNTGIPYIPQKEQENHPDSAIREGYVMFHEYLETFLKNHLTQETWEYLPKFFGYMILGHNDAKIAPFLHGESNTTKSSFQKLLVATMNDYGAWRDPKIFRNKELNPMLASALPKRIICIGEMGGREMHADHFKNITGNEPVSCELKNSNNGVHMKARCTVISGCNDAPIIPDEDKATRRRFVTIPFRHSVSGADDDPRASDIMQEKCRIAMLAWLIEGCADAIKQGGVRPIPREIAMETEEFANKLSDISSFVDECIELAPESYWGKYALKGEVSSEGRELWRDQKEWCVNEADLWTTFDVWQKKHLQAPEWISKHKLTSRLKNRSGFRQDGQEVVNGKKLRVWVGIKIVGTHRVISIAK